jgi:hypothetical protein
MSLLTSLMKYFWTSLKGVTLYMSALNMSDVSPFRTFCPCHFRTRLSVPSSLVTLMQEKTLAPRHQRLCALMSPRSTVRLKKTHSRRIANASGQLRTRSSDAESASRDRDNRREQKRHRSSGDNGGEEKTNAHEELSRDRYQRHGNSYLANWTMPPKAYPTLKEAQDAVSQLSRKKV